MTKSEPFWNTLFRIQSEELLYRQISLGLSDWEHPNSPSHKGP